MEYHIITINKLTFCGLKKLESLPDISKWNMKNCVNLSSMFEGCENLRSLPDLSKWNTQNLKSKEDMFKGCKYLEGKIPAKFLSQNLSKEEKK